MRWTKDECARVMREFEESCENVGLRATISEYYRWSKGRHVPSPHTIESRFGSWNDARLMSNMSPVKIRVNKFSLSECLIAIRDYEAYCELTGKNVTRDGFQTWHLQTPGTCSIGPIEHFGSWNEMRMKAAEDPTKLRLNKVRHRPSQSR